MPSMEIRNSAAPTGKAVSASERPIASSAARVRILFMTLPSKWFATTNQRPGVNTPSHLKFRRLRPATLGMRVEVVEAIIAEKDEKRLLKDVIADVPPLAKHGGD